MGQQQLLLIILVAVIIGVATVVALQVTDAQLDEANETAVRQDIQSIAASARTFYLKPDNLGGGGNSFSNITFNYTSIPKKGLSSDGLKTYNENGTYVITSRSSNQFTVEAYPSSNEGYDNSNPLSSTDGTALTAVVKSDTLEFQ